MNRIIIKMINLFRIAVFIAVVVSICLAHSYSLLIKFLLIAGVSVLNLNDFFRIRFLYKKKRQVFILSLIVSMLGAGAYYYLLHNAAVSTYFIFPLAEIFTHNTDSPYTLTILTIFDFLVFMASNVRVPLSEMGIAALTYGMIVFILFFFRYSNLERTKEKQLNEELQDANAKLKKYSAEIQNITRVEERARIAQELHDSIGHGLVALGMNLEFAESTMQLNPSKAAEAIMRARGQSKKCMEDLRKAVTALRNEPSSKASELRDSLKELFGRFQPERVTFDLSFDDRVENESPEIKDCIYKTVREAVTNGIRHGRAGLFTIAVAKNEEKIALSVKDDGQGCQEIRKSDGLSGIQKRVSRLGGTIWYHSEPGNGFYLETQIPSGIQEEGKSND